MISKIAILFQNFGPYHVVRIKALNNIISKYDIKLTAIRFSELSSTYSWNPILPDDIDVITLLNDPSPGILGFLIIFFKFIKAVRKRKIEIILIPSYSPLPNFLCLLATKLLGRKAILMCDSWKETEQTNYIGQSVKKILVRLFDSALVAGKPHVDFVNSYGQPKDKIFTGYDVVDNKYFETESKRWKQILVQELPVKNLPNKYFLNLGRFIPKKNLKILVKAFLELGLKHPNHGFSLVLVGEGSEEESIRKLAKELGLKVRNGLTETKFDESNEIVFYPFQQIELTPVFFARCEAFILPSLIEEWGLVINEALASGAPVIVSKNVGCVQDLVFENQNGFTFNPNDLEQLTSLLEKFVLDPSLSKKLSNNTFKYVEEWNPEKFGLNAFKAVLAAERNMHPELIDNFINQR